MTISRRTQLLSLGVLFGILFGLCLSIVAVRAANDASDKYGLYSVMGSDEQKSLYLAGKDVGTVQGNELLPNTIGNLINLLLSFIGVIFFILMLAAGILWMTSRGNEEKTTQAVQIIYAAIVGIIIVMGSYALTRFVFRVSGSDNQATASQCVNDGLCKGKNVGDECSPGNVCGEWASSGTAGITCICVPPNTDSSGVPTPNGNTVAVCKTKPSVTSSCQARSEVYCNRRSINYLQLCNWDDALRSCLPKVDCGILNDQDCNANTDSCDLTYETR
jgi:hypothetical protein